MFSDDDFLKLKLGLDSKPAEKEFQGFLKGLEGSASSAKFDDVLSGKFKKSFFDVGQGNDILNTQKRQADFAAFNQNMMSVGNNMTEVGKKMTLFATLPIGAAIGAATKEAVDFNSAINNTVRSLDLTTEETESFSAEVLKLAPSLGLLPKEFANVAAEAGKMGVAKDEVAKFGATLAELATIADTPIEQFVQLGGSIKTVFRQNTEEFNVFGAAVNALDDKIGGTTPNILDFTSRMGAIGKSIGFNAQEMAAFGATFEKLGFKSDVAGTAFKNLVNQLFTISSASEPAKEAFESLGFSAVEFGKEMEADPKAALKRFLDTLNAVGSESEKSSLLVKIFGNEGLAAITSLAGSTDILSEAFGIAADDTANLDKKMREFAGKMNDPAVQARVLSAQINALSIQFGKVFIPILSQALTFLLPLASGFGEFLANNPAWAKFIAIAAVGVAVIGPLVVVIGSLVSAIGAIGAAFSAGGVLAGLVAFVAGIGLWPVAIAAAVVAIGAFIFNVGGMRDKVLGFMKNIADGVSFYVRDFIISWKNGSNETINTIGWLASQIPVALFNGLVGLGQMVANAFWSVIDGIRYALGGVGNVIIESLNGVIGVLGGFASAFFNSGASLIKSFAGGISSAASEAYNAVSGVVGNVRQYLPFSPAKVGPLSDLDKSGESFFETFARGLDSEVVQQKLNQVLNGLDLQSGTAPSLATVGTSASNSASPVNISYVQNIEFESKVDSQDVIKALKNSQRDFLQYLSEAQFIINRKQS